MLLKSHARDLLAKAGVPDEEGDGAYPINNYNVAPTSKVAVVRTRPGPEKKKRECVSLYWGMPRRGAAGESLMVNVRAESLLTKTGFREALSSRRCLVPASGFFEWEKAGEARFPWLFQLKDAQPFFLAGIWEPMTEGRASETCAIITTEPNGVMRPVHHRMPVIVLAEDAARWLDGDASVGTGGTRAEARWFQPLKDELMAARRVSRYVNNARNHGAECIAEPGLGDVPEGRQGWLF